MLEAHHAFLVLANSSTTMIVFHIASRKGRITQLRTEAHAAVPFNMHGHRTICILYDIRLFPLL